MGAGIEACLNLWFVVDGQTKLIYRVASRAYALSGTDDEKARILKQLSKSDFYLADHFSLSKYKTTIVDQTGRQRSMPGLFNNASFEVVLPDILEIVCRGIEEKFPKQPKVTAQGIETYQMVIPEHPY